jgi:PadR family transcriptional regulator AphA
MRRTSTTTNALLGLLGLRPNWSSAELAAPLARNLRFFWPRAESRTYAALRGLESDGLARTTAEPMGPVRNRTRYAISAAGRRRLRAWLASPPRATVLECEPLLRVLLGHLGTPDQVATAVEQIRIDAEAIRDVGRTVGQEYMTGAAPFQDHVQTRALVFDFLTSWSTMLNDWAERSSKTLAAWPDQSPEQRERSALQTIRANLAEIKDQAADPD